MPRKILVFFMSMVLLGSYGIGVYRAQADSDVDQFPIYLLIGKVWIDYLEGINEVYLQPTLYVEHKQYTIVPIVRSLDPPTNWTELTAREYQMGSVPEYGDEYSIIILDTDETDGIPIQKGTNFEMRIAIYVKGDKSTQLDVNIGTPTGEPWYVGKNTTPGGVFAEADVYSSIPPGQPQNLQASATVGSEIHNINLQWTAPGSDNGIGTVSGYLAKLSTSNITTEGQWDAATDLTTGWTSLRPAGETENRTAISSSALTPSGTYYVALRAVDAAGTLGPFTSAQVNMPPKAANVAIAPSDPPTAETTDNLVLTYTYSDPEADPESGTLIKWYKGGVHQPAYNNQNPLPSSATKKGETWKASVQPANANGVGLEVESNEITILNTPPVADADGPYSSRIDSGGTTVLPITFNGAGSTDADGDALTYSWDFGDGGTGTGVSPTYTYSAENLVSYPKTYSVSLTVNDGEADSDPDGASATVTINQKPVAHANGPYEGIAGEPLTLDGSGSTDADDTAPDDLIFAWDFENDATPDFVSPRGTPTAEHTYPSHGTYTVSLVVSDYLEDSAPDTASVLVRTRPVADFTWSPDPQNEGLPVDFTDASTDADGTIVLWVWDFGDGSGDVGQNPSHTYTDNGPYTVELTVTDDDGLTDTEQHVVTVNNVAPVVNAGSDQTVNEGDTLFLNGSFTDPGTADTHTATIDWGDGTPVEPGTVNESNGSGTVTASHIYSDGIYTVTLTVTDDDGGSWSDAFDVNCVVCADVILTAGWNMISWPGEPIPGNVADIVAENPGVLPYFYTWDPGIGGYVIVNEVRCGDGYWVAATQDCLLRMCYIPVYELTRELITGWNMVGSLHCDIPLEEALASVMESVSPFVYTWDPTTGAYILVDYVRAGAGHWLAATCDCVLNMNCSAPLVESQLFVNAGEPSWKSILTVESQGRSQVLAFGMHPLASDGFDRLLDKPLPPPPAVSSDGEKKPGNDKLNGILRAVWMIQDDVFSMLSESYVRKGSQGVWELSVELPKPGKIEWSGLPEGYSCVLHHDKRSIDMNTKKFLPLPAGEYNLTLVLDALDSLPRKTQLLANYPNPFNPETWIPYELKEDNDVTIRIYTATGQLVRTLSLGHKPAGFYTTKAKAAYWDGRNEAGEQVASGIYFYTIKAGGFTATKKMVIAR